MEAPHAHAIITYDPAAQFSASSNPNGVWSYGFSTTLGSPLILDTVRASFGGLDWWEGVPTASFSPNVVHNPAAVADQFSSAIWGPGAIAMNPGINDQFTIVRFTVPSTGLYKLAGSFSGIDFLVGTTTDVHIL